jgi:hypothetical protein
MIVSEVKCTQLTYIKTEGWWVNKEYRIRVGEFKQISNRAGLLFEVFSLFGRDVQWVKLGRGASLTYSSDSREIGIGKICAW